MSLWGCQLNSPTCNLVISLLLLSVIYISVYLTTTKLAVRIKANKRVGPHNLNFLSVIYGSLLGNGSLEVRGQGIRTSFYHEAFNAEFLLWLHSFMTQLGYCTPSIPTITTRLGLGGILRYIIRFHTFSYSSLSSVYDS